MDVLWRMANGIPVEADNADDYDHQPSILHRIRAGFHSALSRSPMYVEMKVVPAGRVENPGPEFCGGWAEALTVTLESDYGCMGDRKWRIAATMVVYNDGYTTRWDAQDTRIGVYSRSEETWTWATGYLVDEISQDVIERQMLTWAMTHALNAGIASPTNCREADA